jgi:hypothetical protein
MSKNIDVLRKEIDEQIDDLILGLNNHIAYREDNVITPGTAAAMLQCLDRRVKLWGINSAEKVEISVADEIRQAQSDLYAKLKGDQNA